MPASAPRIPGTCLPGPPDTACRLRAIPLRRTPPLLLPKSRPPIRSPDRGLPNRNIAAIEPRAHIGQASDFSPISNLQIESKIGSSPSAKMPARCSRDALKSPNLQKQIDPPRISSQIPGIAQTPPGFIRSADRSLSPPRRRNRRDPRDTDWSPPDADRLHPRPDDSQADARIRRLGAEEVLKLYDLPFMDLIHRAQQTHRAHFDPNAIQLSSLLSIKTGGCPEDCAYRNPRITTPAWKPTS